MTEANIKKNTMSLTPQLKVFTIEGEQLLFDVKEGLNFIGRKSNSSGPQDINISIQTRDTKISRKHCCLKLEKRGKQTAILLFDAESSNGTFLKNFHNKPLTEYDVIYLKHNDQITVGETKMILEVPLNIDTVDAEVQIGKINKTKTVLWSIKR